MTWHPQPVFDGVYPWNNRRLYEEKKKCIFEAAIMGKRSGRIASALKAVRLECIGRTKKAACS